MLVNGPLREENIRVLRRQQAAELVVVSVIDYRAAVNLTGEEWSGLQYPTGSLCFGGPDLTASTRRSSFAETFTSIEVKQKQHRGPKRYSERWCLHNRIPDLQDDRPQKQS